MTTAQLLWGVLFGSIGFGYFLYGKKQRTIVPFLCGLVLMIIPYFIPNTVLLALAGAAITAVPYFVRF